MDRLSDLPEDVLLHIISFLGTKVAARTSLVSRRFRHLWESSPFINLETYPYRSERVAPSKFVDLANRIILHRDPPSPILRLLLRCHYYVQTSYIASLIDKAGILGLRHLTIDLQFDMWPTILPHIFTLHSLEFLTLECVSFFHLPYSTPINLKNLKSLCFFHRGYDAYNMNRLISQLNALEDLNITCFCPLDVNSITVRKLKLTVFHPILRISAPSLELFELQSRIDVSSIESIQWVWEMPMLRKAIIQFKFLGEKNAEVISKMLNIIAHVQELHLDITRELYEEDIFHALLVPFVDPPTFIKLKHFHLEICFHELNIEDLVTIIQHSPSLESLKLVHKPPDNLVIKKKKKLWRSMLPRNAEGNYRHAHYEDLHIAEKKVDLLRKLIKKGSSKRLKTINFL